MQPPNKNPIFRFVILAAVTAIFTFLAPLEKTLGANARIVYMHGAWVWVAMLAFMASALAGAAALIVRKPSLNQWSQGLGWTGLLFWLTFLPMSLYVMQANWNGLFLDEPRFRIPLNLAIVALLLQTGMYVFSRPVWTSAANLIYGIVLFSSMIGVNSILHPDSPIFSSESRTIQIYFAGIFIFLVASALQLTSLLMQHIPPRRESI